ncbi:MAG: phosphodiesterase [Candidatus Eremiobacteraeota bacterium]|nr:phosphodiesterase [Candidatus Eremiobacteraeota bacterium]MBC5802238.1 phosphodiesterase [Candidatus Eremiobacteraeota bacterium]MBC5820572.1 phosphodiesterase [Candidatus Eremiobacteraeota bacterium]
MLHLTDTHIVRRDRRSGIDTAAYLRDALTCAAALQPAPDYAIVTGDLVDGGKRREYEHFAEIMSALPIPYVVVPGNHDDREHLRATLEPATFGGSHDETIRFSYDGFKVRLIGLDVTRPGRPGAHIDDENLAWLAARLAEAPQHPTILAMHQPPFRSGLHYLDVFGFRGASRLRKLIDAAPQIGRVICGHIHTVKIRRWRHALAMSAPSTAPQSVPELFERRIFGVRREPAGFAVIDWAAGAGFKTTVYRRASSGAYSPQ